MEQKRILKKKFCCEKPHLYFQNEKTLEKIPVRCNTYGCPDCGPIKAYKLKKALTIFLSKWKNIRFWTFTLKSVDGMSVEAHWKILSECWRRFTTYMRRNKSIKEQQRKFDYIKVFEAHESGFLHIHAFFSEYLPYKIVQQVWESICQEVMGISTHCGQSFVKGLCYPAVAAKYVSKYVLKLAQSMHSSIRRYSKSSRVCLFPKKESSGDWQFVNEKAFVTVTKSSEIFRKMVESGALLVPIMSNFTLLEAEHSQKLPNLFDLEEKIE
ncbi:MAG: hypothetical protein WC042_02435 [Candidatus Paceibacterota bacterium]|jgi:hypothetical protein